MTATICIPARLQSTRLKEKLLQKIEGKSLLQHTYENLVQAGFENILILVDDKKMDQEAKGMGADSIMTPSSCINGTERISYALGEYPERFVHDLIVNVQGDEPLLDTSALKNLIAKHKANKRADVFTLCTKINFEKAKSPSCVKVVVDQENRALYFSRSPIPYHIDPAKIDYLHHIGVYSYQKKLLQTLQSLPTTPCQRIEDLEQLKILEKGYTIYCLRSEKPSIGIDTHEDLQSFKEVLCKQKFYSSQEA